MRRKLLITGLIFAPVAATGGLLLVAIGLSRFGHLDQAQKADAIIIFGARVYRGGVPSPILRSRTHHAFDLWKQGLAPLIVCTGAIGDYAPAESVVESQLLRGWGVPEKAILRDEASTSTLENARNAAELLPEKAVVIAVSDPYHLWRARRDCRKFGLKAFPSPALEGWPEIVWTKRFAMTLREAVLVVRDVVFDFF